MPAYAVVVGRQGCAAALKARQALQKLMVLAIPLALAMSPASATDSGAAALYRYLDGLRTLDADFTQAVSDAHGAATESGGGSLEVQRPDRFRWDYRPHGDTGGAANEADSGQLLVADGRNLWFYDRELAQVTVKPIDAALASTPIMLLSSSPAQLRDAFDMTPGGTREGLLWVEVKPRSAEADFAEAELGFDGQRLARMVVHDKLGQTVRLDFRRSERNGALPATLFEFKPPAGVDLIGKPR